MNIDQVRPPKVRSVVPLLFELNVCIIYKYKISTMLKYEE